MVIPGLAVCGVTLVSQAPVASQWLCQRSCLNQSFPDVLASRSCSSRECGWPRAFCVPSGSPNSNWPPLLCPRFFCVSISSHQLPLLPPSPPPRSFSDCSHQVDHYSLLLLISPLFQTVLDCCLLLEAFSAFTGP